MKRKYASRSDWKRILEREYKQVYVQDDNYTGHISLLILKKVREPLFVSVGETEKYCVADQGYKWLQYFPSRGNYSLTTMFNERGEVIQWYFDVAHEMTVTITGEPCFDDLYLNVVVLPNYEYYLLDEDELQEAMDNNVIGIDDFNLAITEADRLMNTIESRSNPLLTRCFKDLLRLEAL